MTQYEYDPNVHWDGERWINAHDKKFCFADPDRCAVCRTKYVETTSDGLCSACAPADPKWEVQRLGAIERGLLAPAEPLHTTQHEVDTAWRNFRELWAKQPLSQVIPADDIIDWLDYKFGPETVTPDYFSSVAQVDITDGLFENFDSRRVSFIRALYVLPTWGYKSVYPGTYEFIELLLVGLAGHIGLPVDFSTEETLASSVQQAAQSLDDSLSEVVGSVVSAVHTIHKYELLHGDPRAQAELLYSAARSRNLEAVPLYRLYRRYVALTDKFNEGYVRQVILRHLEQSGVRLSDKATGALELVIASPEESA